MCSVHAVSLKHKCSTDFSAAVWVPVPTKMPVSGNVVYGSSGQSVGGMEMGGVGGQFGTVGGGL